MDGRKLDFFQAMKERDLRFDGRFFAGIVTTGVYCRVVCPAPRPAKLENVRLFASAAAAEEAGFRPCKCCHPERAPEAPLWSDFPPVVSHGLALIAEGFLDESGVRDLAMRLGTSSRHLRRLFEDHLGASPLAIAKSRRVHFARKLIDETDLSFSQIAFTAGFQSIRQFNHDLRRTFGLPPREIRRPGTRGRGNEEVIVLSLPYRPPLDWPKMVSFLQARATKRVEVVEHDRYRRTVELDGVPGVIEIRVEANKPHLMLRLGLPSASRLGVAVERARRIFDLGADPAAVSSHLINDPLIGRFVRARPGLRVPGAFDGFEVAVRAVLGQQISVRAATTLAGRVVEYFGKPIDGFDEPGLTHLFPRPDVLAETDLTSLGVTRAQAIAVRAIAREVADGRLDLDTSLGLEEFVGRLCTLPGIGPWTAHYVAMRLGEPDAFPSGDLGLRRAASAEGAALSSRELEHVAEAWRPWRAYAAMYLWTRDSTRSQGASRR